MVKSGNVKKRPGACRRSDGLPAFLVDIRLFGNHIDLSRLLRFLDMKSEMQYPFF